MIPDPQEPADADLIRHAARGDKAAYEVLVKRHYQKIFSLAMNMVQNEADALDLAQETFVKAWRNLGKFRGQSSFTTWLHRITVNLGIDLFRKRKHRIEIGLDRVLPARENEADRARITDPGPHPSAGLQRRELRETINQALARLSPEHRAVIVLREFEEMDYNQIAETVGCSTGTVMSRLFYARRHLQKLLRDKYER